MSKEYEHQYQIKSYDIDFRNKLKIPKLFNLLQETAYHHSYRLNAGYEKLMEDNYFWVLSRIYIEIDRLPEWGDNIKIKTWPKGKDRLFGLRDYEITDENSDKIIRVTSYWLMVNYKLKRPVRIDSAIDNFEYIENRHAIDKSLEKLNFNKKVEKSSEGEVRYSDIDINQHMNNAKYVEWCFDDLDIEVIKHKEFSSIEANFMSEVNFDDKLILNNFISNNNIGYVFRNKDKDIFKILIETN